MNVSVEGKNVVLIDDVLFTGRSIRSALDFNEFWSSKTGRINGVDRQKT